MELSLGSVRGAETRFKTGDGDGSSFQSLTNLVDVL